MTAISASNLRSFQVEDFPSNTCAGTARRLGRVHIECVTGATSDTLNLATYRPNISDIMGFDYITLDGADLTVGTANLVRNTWSTSTITFAGHSGSGVWEFGCTVKYT